MPTTTRDAQGPDFFNYRGAARETKESTTQKAHAALWSEPADQLHEEEGRPRGDRHCTAAIAKGWRISGHWRHATGDPHAVQLTFAAVLCDASIRVRTPLSRLTRHTFARRRLAAARYVRGAVRAGLHRAGRRRAGAAHLAGHRVARQRQARLRDRRPRGAGHACLRHRPRRRDVARRALPLSLCQFPPYRRHGVFSAMEPRVFRRNGATSFSAYRSHPRLTDTSI